MTTQQGTVLHILLLEKTSSFIFTKSLVEPPNSQYFSDPKIVFSSFFKTQILLQSGTVQTPDSFCSAACQEFPGISPFCSWALQSLTRVTQAGSPGELSRPSGLALRVCLPALMAAGSSHPSQLHTDTLSNSAACNGAAHSLLPSTFVSQLQPVTAPSSCFQPCFTRGQDITPQRQKTDWVTYQCSGVFPYSLSRKPLNRGLSRERGRHQTLTWT